MLDVAPSVQATTVFQLLLIGGYFLYFSSCITLKSSNIDMYVYLLFILALFLNCHVFAFPFFSFPYPICHQVFPILYTTCLEVWMSLWMYVHSSRFTRTLTSRIQWLLMMNEWMFLFPQGSRVFFHLPKYANRWIGCSKLPLGTVFPW